MLRQKDCHEGQQPFEKYYSGRKFRDSLYRDPIWKHLPAGTRLLDAECGRYFKYSNKLTGVAEVIGIDLESTPQVQESELPARDSRQSGPCPDWRGGILIWSSPGAWRRTWRFGAPFSGIPRPIEARRQSHSSVRSDLLNRKTRKYQ
jgi:hypothetical protein